MEHRESKQRAERGAIARRILDFLRFSEAIKRELRHSWLADGRRESVAEHSWQMALMAILMHRHLDKPVDVERTLKMILIHDLVEAEAGDVPFFEKGERKERKAERERAAIDKIRTMLDPETGEEIYELWHELESRDTPEARFATALDNLEVQVQHNLAPLSTWEPIEYELVYTKMDRHCQYDALLGAFCDLVKSDAESKMRAGGVDVDEVKAKL